MDGCQRIVQVTIERCVGATYTQTVDIRAVQKSATQGVILAMRQVA